ncbi:PEP-CTERM sorting domain-containing protein [Adhaeretor mobilis]|uniref:Ice-binding protein C-terminal domain-containing protein n=1 Tax=Adhaeretor mobilis TaxID=1930276 RepID=A0A517MYK4_9BACT|nr:PEP-CTERM sorting domain-containing protein [Adhaeretor mobilis]QDS99946.1 hypothetical protein HG15A2_32800 [Adhaeretor mobilis]
MISESKHDRCLRILAHNLLAACVLLSCASSSLAAITIDVDDVTWPTEGTGVDMAEVLTADLTSSFSWQSTADPTDVPISLSQTFQVTTGFDLNSIYMNYNSLSDGTPINLGLEIYSVADVGATLLEDSNVNNLLLTEMFAAPDEGGNTIMRLFLDSPLTLPSTAGTAGYAFRIIDQPQTDFEWRRSGNSAGNVYAGGSGYIGPDEIEPLLGGRDFSLGLSSQALPPPLPIFVSVQSGNINDASTWSSGAVPVATHAYNIVGGHTVAANTASFSGGEVVAQSGGTLDVTFDAADIPEMIVEAGGTLVSSASGDFALGKLSATPLNDLDLDGSANFTPDAGSSVFMDVDLSGEGVVNFQGNGSSSHLWLTATDGFKGTVNFNGNGDEVHFEDGEGIGGTLVMNSTGANRVVIDGSASSAGGTFAFNQPGEIEHKSDIATGRLQGPDKIVANAEVTVNLTNSPPVDELRLFVTQGLTGSANIIVNGTAADPTFATRTRNEFEIGSTGEPETLPVDDYSGTITTNDYVDVEIRRSQPNAQVVVNNKGTLEMGHESVTPDHSVAIGEVVVNSGGILEVGYQAKETGDWRYPYQLTLTDSGTRSGDLTLANGTFTRMQVNGTAAGEFDSIVADGTITLDGTLQIYVDPDSRPGLPLEINPVYDPIVGDTFDIINISGGPLLAADFDGSGTVDGLDLADWETAYGVDDNADANGDGLSNGLDFLAWQLQSGESSSGGSGSIVGTFDGFTIVDPKGKMAGLTFQINYVSSTLVQLEVISVSIQAVPEPNTLVMMSMAIVSLVVRRRR